MTRRRVTTAPHKKLTINPIMLCRQLLQMIICAESATRGTTPIQFLNLRNRREIWTFEWSKCQKYGRWPTQLKLARGFIKRQLARLFCRRSESKPDTRPWTTHGAKSWVCSRRRTRPTSLRPKRDYLLPWLTLLCFGIQFSDKRMADYIDRRRSTEEARKHSRPLRLRDAL